MTKKVWGIILTVFGSLALVFVGFALICTLLAGIGVGVMGTGITGVMGEVMQLQVAEGASVESTEGAIIETGNGYSVVSYWADGEYYEQEFSFSSSNLPEGSSVTVEYDSSNPNNAVVAEMFDVLSDVDGIMGGTGIVVILVMCAIFLPLLIIAIIMLIVGIILIKKGNKQIKEA